MPPGDGNREKTRTKKKDKPIKVVIRRLPAAMTWAELSEQLSPLPDCQLVSFVSGDPTFIPHSFSRCYLSFTDENAVMDFSNRFNRYIFVDGSGQESMAIVELAMYNKVPRKNRKDVLLDHRCGTIEQEVEYLTFLDELEATRNVAVLTIEEQLSFVHLKDTFNKASTAKETPLTLFMIRKNDEKYERIVGRRRDKLALRKKNAHPYAAEKEDSPPEKSDMLAQLAEAKKKGRERRKDKEKAREKEAEGDPSVEYRGSNWKSKEFRAQKMKEKAERMLKSKVPGPPAAPTEKTNKVDPETKRLDWEKFKKELKIGEPDRCKPERPVAADGVRTFVRSKARTTERTTAASTEEKKKPRVRPEREIYRPGMSKRAGTSKTSTEGADQPWSEG